MSIDVVIDQYVARLVIDRPHKCNSLTLDMWEAIPPILGRLAADRTVRALVVTGAGQNFSAGADLVDLERHQEVLVAASVAAEEAVATFPKPTVAAIDGACVGGGCQLAVACDFRVADSTAKMGVTAARLGMVYPTSSVRALLALVGPAVAKLVLYSGKVFGSDEAQRIGLVDDIAPAGQVDEKVRTLMDELSGRSRLTQCSSKDVINHLLRGTCDSALERRWATEMRTSGELKEGIRAFRERAAPQFPWSAT